MKVFKKSLASAEPMLLRSLQIELMSPNDGVTARKRKRAHYIYMAGYVDQKSKE